MKKETTFIGIIIAWVASATAGFIASYIDSTSGILLLILSILFPPLFIIWYILMLFFWPMIYNQ